MPIFEYRCPKCGKLFEKLVMSRSQEPPACPKCGSTHVDQQFSSFSAASTSSTSSRATCAPSGGG
ncbi:MAG: zinc ribbon domain-containing protein [Acidobacteriia bacterium]|nr:zinc ribbon domain-containing protein [Terriglobia bacterium]